LNQGKRILLLSGNQLCNNPRAIKEADALAEAGHRVVVLGANFTAAGCARDQKIMIGRPWEFRYAFDLANQSWGVFWMKLQRKAGLALHKYLGFQNRWQLGYGGDALLKQVMAYQPNLVVAHWDVVLGVCKRLMDAGVPVGIDMEDWFSEDLIPEARKERPIKLMKRLEKKILCDGAWSTCTSEAMADALVEAYGCRRPVVIRNVFPEKDREKMDGMWIDRPEMEKWMARNEPWVERPQNAPVSIHWYSQTIGPGRGLEELFNALNIITGEWELHLRGNLRGYEKWLNKVCPSGVGAKLKLHSQVSREELPSRISEHDIGFCGEPASPPNKNLTISNKFFQYISAGLAVVASDTKGQIEGANKAKGAVVTFTAGNTESIKEALETLLENKHRLNEMRGKAWEAGGRLCWENEKVRYHGV
jgi:glycosyltransferase involved in cell wall biosynthesis